VRARNDGEHGAQQATSGAAAPPARESAPVVPVMVPWPTPPALSEVLSSANAHAVAASATALRSRAPQQQQQQQQHQQQQQMSNLSTREQELKQKIQALQDTVAEYERQKFNVIGTFAEYR
jgi:hypothetical protein